MQPGLPDPVSYQETCFNHALTLWDQMGAARRTAFMAWATLVGVGNYPGFFASGTVLAAARSGRMAEIPHQSGRASRSVFSGAGAPPVIIRTIAEAAQGRLMRIGIVTRRVGRNDGQGRVNMEVAREALRQGFGVKLFCESADPALADAGAEIVALPPPAFLPSRLLRDQVFAARSAAALRWLRRGAQQRVRHLGAQRRECRAFRASRLGGKPASPLAAAPGYTQPLCAAIRRRERGGWSARRSGGRRRWLRSPRN